MLTRYTLFFFFLLGSLTTWAQQWQAYLNSTYIIGGAETEGRLWLACSNSLAKIDLRTGEEELLHFQNSPLLPYLSDIQQMDEDAFVMLGGGDQLLTYREGAWSTRALPLQEGTLRHIAGRTQDGTLLMTAETKLYQLPPTGDLQLLTYPDPMLENRYIQAAELDRQDRLWLMSNDQVMRFAPDGTLLAEYAITDEYFYDMRLDDADNLWLTSSDGIYFWHRVSDTWSSITNQEISDTNYGATINTTFGEAAIVSIFTKTYHLRWTDGSFAVSDWSEHFGPNDRPNAHCFRDRQDQLWYLNVDRELSTWKIGEHAPGALSRNPWLSLNELSALGLDPQGKVWLGGVSQAAYLSGGRWHSVPLETTSDFVSIGINDFAFQDNGYPIVGTGNLFVFGFPDSQVRAYNGTSWDTLTGATLTTSFLPVTDVILDQEDNLWVLRSGDVLLSVYSWGDWHRIRTTNLPPSITNFYTLAEDPAGGMWIGTNNGLLYHDGFSATHIDTATLKTNGYPIISIAIDEQGKKWLSLGEGGLRRETDTGWEVIDDFRDLVPFGSLNKVVCGTYPELWISMNWNGVLHYDGDNWSHWDSENSGLVDNYVRDMLVDSRGRTWFCHGSGLSVYTPSGELIEPYRRPAEQSVGVYPNPGCCQFNVSWAATQAGKHELRLYTAGGQLVRRWSVNTERVGEQTFRFEQAELPIGTYFLSIRRDDRQIGTARMVFIR